MTANYVDPLDAIAIETHSKLLKLKIGEGLRVGLFTVTRKTEDTFEFLSLTGHNPTSGSATGIASMVTMLSPRQKAAEAGFTLIELLMVMGLVSYRRRGGNSSLRITCILREKS